MTTRNDLLGTIALAMGAPDAIGVLIAHLHSRGLIDPKELAALLRLAARQAAAETPSHKEEREVIPSVVADWCELMATPPDGTPRPAWLRGVIDGGKRS